MIRKLTVLSMALVCTLSLSFGATVSATSATDSSEAKSHKSSIKWPKDQELPTFAKPKRLDVANVYKESGDIKLLLTSLQGIVNREEPRIYVQQNEVDPWIQDLEVPFKLHDNVMDVFKAYAKEVKGIIVYDPAIPDSINVASTLAGLKDAVVASPELAKQLTAKPYRLKVLDDLQGKFKDRLDAYTWQYENLWSQTTKRMLVGLSPNTSIPMPPNNFDSFSTVAIEKEQVRDGSNRKTYDLDLSSLVGTEAVYLRFQDAFPQDGWGPAVHEITVKADGKDIINFKTGTSEEESYLYDRQNSKFLPGSDHRFADNGNYFVYEFMPPADTKELTVSVDMRNQFNVSASNVKPFSSEEKEPYGYLRDYAIANKAMIFWLSTDVPEQRALFEKILSEVDQGTPYLGWFANDFEGEVAGIDITSKHGVYVVPSDWFHNMTVFSGTKLKEKQKAKPVTPELNNKIYVTFTFGEGDNLQYDQNHMRNLWEDPARGQVPINWTSSPLLYDAAPAILNYYWSTATDNDQLVAGPSGAGYFSPQVWPETSIKDFMKDSYPYLKKSNMSFPYVLNRELDKDIPLTESIAEAYEKYLKVPGLFLGAGDKMGVEIVNGTLPVSMLRGVATVQDGKDILKEFKESWDGNSPTFISVGINAWSMRPSDVLAIAESLGSEYEVVRADQYFSLIREANGLPVKP
ncbi:GxGYxYP domain-containing protein [Paenibacillus sp. Marseille-Q4541]|uniref:GxGYxYP domain-containing protein n=1 Tax=Paenibacillus sp. Marseille-Q4541 TaxID=2831522 RepID=UPI001BABE87C